MSNNTVGRVNKQIGQLVGVGETTVMKVETLLQKASVDQLKRLREGKARISKLYYQLELADKKLKLQNQEPILKLPNNDNIKLLNCDCSCLMNDNSAIPDNSIGLIFTDPLYYEKDLYLYEILAKISARVLKPGCSVIAYAPNGKQHIIINYMEATGQLKYLQEIAVVYENRNIAKLWNIGVWAAWKPLLWFVKGEDPLFVKPEIRNAIFSDTKPDKLESKYTQSTIEAEKIIPSLTVENQIVLDPFMGVGTFGLAALRLKRKFIGVEVNEDTFRIAQNNFAKAITTTDGGGSR